MKDSEQSFKEILESICERPLTKRELKKLRLALFEQVFKKLVDEKCFAFPKGYGSLRVKQARAYNFKKVSGEEVQVPSRLVIRYYPGRLIKRRISNE